MSINENAETRPARSSSDKIDSPPSCWFAWIAALLRKLSVMTSGTLTRYLGNREIISDAMTTTNHDIGLVATTTRGYAINGEVVLTHGHAIPEESEASARTNNSEMSDQCFQPAWLIAATANVTAKLTKKRKIARLSPSKPAICDTMPPLQYWDNPEWHAYTPPLNAQTVGGMIWPAGNPAHDG